MRAAMRSLVLIASVLSLLAASAASAADPAARDFYAAVQDTLGDFEQDLRNAALKDPGKAENISIRDIALSENLPRSFGGHLETLITEKILKATQSKIIQCIGCKARRTTLTDDNLKMTSPRTNQQELARIAKARGIDNFLDVVFTYQPSGIVMSITMTKPADGRVTWSKTYNSETSKAAQIRRGLENEQMDASVRKATEYPATLQYRVSVDYLFEPNIGTTTGCLGLSFRMVERYDNRKKEIGFQAQYLKDSSTLIGSSAASSSDNLYSGINLTLFVLHAWNLIGGEENLDRARGGFYVGVGGTFSPGYLGGLFRGGFEWRLAKHVAATAHLGYRPPSTAFLSLSDSTGESVSGIEYGGGVSFLF